MQIVEPGKIKSRHLSRVARYLLGALFVLFVVSFIIIVRVSFKYRDHIYSAGGVPDDYSMVMVFGAGLKSRGVPGRVLESRITKALELYNSGKVELVMMSGDNSSANHNEVQAMKNFALKEGLPESALILDHAGTSTYESCYRLRYAYNFQKVILVTQKYHLPRALYDCRELGVDAVGVPASGQIAGQYRMREFLASLSDWLKVNIWRPTVNLTKD